jgi:rsbT antagonist protein RsbS
MQNIPILRIGKTLLTTINAELEDRSVDNFQNALLTSIESKGADGLIIDISSLDSIDSYVAKKLVETGMMAKLMGTETVVVGVRPEVAATLTRMGFRFQVVHTALSLEEGMTLLSNLIQHKNLPQGTFNESTTRPEAN